MQVLRMKPRRTGLGRGDPSLLSPSRGRARAIASVVPTICACPRATCMPSPHAPVRSKTVLIRLCPGECPSNGAYAEWGMLPTRSSFIVLGGTWSDYPREYQIWLCDSSSSAPSTTTPRRVWRQIPCSQSPGASTRERAAELLEQTDPHEVPQAVLDRRARYRDLRGVSTDAEAIARGVASVWQRRIDDMSDTDAYARIAAWRSFYGERLPMGKGGGVPGGNARGARTPAAYQRDRRASRGGACDRDASRRGDAASVDAAFAAWAPRRSRWACRA